MIDSSFVVSPLFGASRIFLQWNLYMNYFTQILFICIRKSFMYMYVENRVATKERLLL